MTPVVWTGSTTELLARGTGRGLRALLDAAFDGGFADSDWEHTLGGWHVVVSAEGLLVSHAAVVPRTLHVAGHGPVSTGYVEGVATRPDRQGRGHGRTVMTYVGEHVRATYALGALSTGRPHFYTRLGWRVWRGATWVAGGGGGAVGEAVRTPDEDGGVLVLLTPGTGALDLDADLTCDWRPGDVW